MPGVLRSGATGGDLPIFLRAEAEREKGEVSRTVARAGDPPGIGTGSRGLT
jgi:hypothetical protein